MVAAPRLLGGRYRLIEPIGKGGMSVVWRAHDEVLRRRVAVKLLTERQPDEGLLRAEAQAAALLSHPNVTAVYDYGVAGDEPFVVMELLDGVCLADRLTSGPLPWRGAVEMCAYVAAALCAAHAHGLVHRDIKPGNIMLTDNGVNIGVKVVDFGIAAFVGRPPGGPVVGTPGYLAPERLAGETGGPAADVYALGVLLRSALTGRRPDEGHDRPLRGDPPPLPSIAGMPAEVAGLYHDCLVADPNLRPTAATLARRFAALAGVRLGTVDGDPPAATTQPGGAETEALPPARRRAPRIRRAALTMAIAGTVLVFVGAIAAAFVPARSSGAGAAPVSCGVAYRVMDTWPGGATVSLSVANTGGTDINGWTMSFDLKAGLHARTGWNGTWRQHGARVTVAATPDNARIAAGTSTGEVGTNIDGPDATGTPGSFALNGTRCRTIPPAVPPDAARD